ncbi:MAG: IS110 family transposase [Pseudomonadota bacterium]
MTTIVGIDWSRKSHQVNIYNEHGKQLTKRTIKHDYDGFQELHTLIQGLESDPSNCLMAIETDHNQLVDFLSANGYSLYIVAPSVVKASRGRQGHAGVKTDDRDADLLADILRTDRKRLSLWKADHLNTRQLRVKLGWLDDLTLAIGRGHNRLEAHLLRYYPQAVDVFSDLTTQIALQLIIAYPSPAAAARVDQKQFTAFCHQHAYKHPQRIAKAYARFQRPAPFTDLVTETAFADITPDIARRLLMDVQAKADLLRKLQRQFATHSDAHIFASFPGSGPILGPKLLTIFGDHRDRYPTANAVRALAGTAPGTDQSGNRRVIFFRKACNRPWRHTFQQLAFASIRTAPWAALYFEKARLRGLSKSHALRCLANRWVGIIWTCWQRRQPYDEAIHLQNLKRYAR